MRRGTKGLGTIVQLKSGQWRVKVPVGKDLSGGTRYVTRQVATKSEALRVQKQLISLREQHQLIAGPKMTLKAFATDALLTRSDNVSARTHDGYYRSLVNHVFPTLGGKAVSDIRSREIENLLRALRNSLLANTVNNVRTALSKVFSIAERHELIVSNPVRRTEKFKRSEFDKTPVKLPWSPDEARHALECAAGGPMELFLHLVLSTGMRRGEALGLRWSDIDFEAQTISIERAVHREAITQPDGTRIGGVVVTPPKTAKSRRVIEMTLPLIDVLKRHQTDQKLQALEWPEGRDCEDYIFTNSVGNVLDESKLAYRYRKFCQKNGIRQIRIHDLRHTFATILIHDDARNIAAVSKALGHGSLAMTLDTYGKTARVEGQAIIRMGELLFPDRAISNKAISDLPEDIFLEGRHYRNAG